MLERAFFHKDALTKNMIACWDNPKFAYYNSCSFFEEPNFVNSDWNYAQFASVDKEGNVIGYLSANYDRDSSIIGSISIINFVSINPKATEEQKKRASLLFALDIRAFFKKIIREDIFAMRIGAVVGNPAIPHYIRLLERSKYKWVCDGYKIKSDKLPDGKFYDSVSFRVFFKETDIPESSIKASNILVEHIKDFYKEENHE